MLKIMCGLDMKKASYKRSKITWPIPKTSLTPKACIFSKLKAIKGKVSLGENGLNFKKSQGASAVEMALILPILVMILFGIIQFGIAFNNWIALTHAAREGARLAAVGSFNEQAVRNSAPSVSIETVNVSGLNGNIGDPVTVTVIGNVLNIEIPFAGAWPVQLRSTATMRLETSN